MMLGGVAISASIGVNRLTDARLATRATASHHLDSDTVDDHENHGSVCTVMARAAHPTTPSLGIP